MGTASHDPLKYPVELVWYGKIREGATNRAPQVIAVASTRYLYSHGLLRPHRHRSQPAVAVGLFAAHDGGELFLDRLANRANPALAYLDLVHGADWSDLGRRSGEESFRSEERRVGKEG